MENTETDLTDLLTRIVKALVDNPSDVYVKEKGQGESRTLFFQVHCNKKDCGKVIGKGGATIALLRSLMGKALAPTGRRAFIEVADDPEPDGENPYLNKSSEG